MENPEISLVDSYFVYISEPDEVEIIVKALDYFIKSLKRRVDFLVVKPYYNAKEQGWKELIKLYIELAEDLEPSFRLSMPVPLKLSEPSELFRNLIVHNMKIFQYDCKARE